MELKIKLISIIVLCIFLAPFCQGATTTGDSTVLDISAPEGDLAQRGKTAWEKIKISYDAVKKTVGDFLIKQVDGIKIEYDREKKEMLDNIKEYTKENRIIQIIMIFLKDKIVPEVPGEESRPYNGNKSWFA